MNLFGLQIDLPFVSTPDLGWILALVGKTSLLLLAGLMLAVSLRRHSASLRHFLLALVCSVLLLLPLVSWLLPAWHVGLLPNPAQIQLRILDTSGGQDAETSAPAGRIKGHFALADGDEALSSGGERDIAGASVFDFGQLILLSWLVVSAALLIWLALGRLYGLWIVGSAAPDEDGWLEEMAGDIRRKIGLKRPVRLLVSRRLEVPVVYGSLRPRLILPAVAVGWPRDRLEAILCHELAHIKRFDILTQTLAQLTCCAYWFNPLAWLAERRLMIERERACDDVVLDHGYKASEYATYLMDSATDLGDRRNPSWAIVAMAEGTDFKDRVMSVLDPNARRRHIKPGVALAGSLLAVLLILPLSAFVPWPAGALASEPPPEDSSRITIPAVSAGEREESDGVDSSLSGEDLFLRDYGEKQALIDYVVSLYQELEFVGERLHDSFTTGRAKVAAATFYNMSVKKVENMAEVTGILFMGSGSVDFARHEVARILDVYREAMLESLQGMEDSAGRREFREGIDTLYTYLREMASREARFLEGAGKSPLVTAKRAILDELHRIADDALAFFASLD